MKMYVLDYDCILLLVIKAGFTMTQSLAFRPLCWDKLLKTD